MNKLIIIALIFSLVLISGCTDTQSSQQNGETLVQKEEISDGQYEGLFSGRKPFFVFQRILRKEFYIGGAKGYRVRSVLFRKGRDSVSFPQIPCLPYIEDPLAEKMVASFCSASCNSEFFVF